MPNIEGGERIGLAYVDLGANIAPMTAGLAAVTALVNGWVIKTQADMDTAMRNIWTIVDTNEQGIARYQQQIVSLSRTVPQTQKQLAEGFYELVSASVSASDAMYVLEVSSKAAAAGLSTTYTAVDAITTVINAYGIGADKAGIISDVMFKTVDRGKITFEQLAGSMGSVISTAAAAGVSFEEVAAAFATMTRTGISSDEAATALNQTMLSIISPSKDAADMAKALGVEFNLSALQTKGLAGVLKDLNAATGGNVELMNVFMPNVRALKGVLNLTRGEVKDYVKDIEIMTDSLGAADKAFEKQASSVNNAMQMMKNAAMEWALTMGKAAEPAVRSLTGAMTTLSKSFADMPVATQKVILATTAAVTSFGLLKTVLGGIVTMMSGPAGLIFLVGAAAAAIVTIIDKQKNWNEASLKTADAQAQVISQLIKAAEETGNTAGELEKLIKNYETLAGKAVKSAEEQEKFNAVVAGIADIAPGVVTAWDSMGTAISINLDLAKEKMKALIETEKAYLQASYNAATAQVNAMKADAERSRKELTSKSAEMAKIQPLYDFYSVLAADTQAWTGKIAATFKDGMSKSMSATIKELAGGSKSVEEMLYKVFAQLPDMVGDWSRKTAAEQRATLFTMMQEVMAVGSRSANLAKEIANLSASSAAFDKLKRDADIALMKIDEYSKALGKITSPQTTGTGGKTGGSGIDILTKALEESTDAAEDLSDEMENENKLAAARNQKLIDEATYYLDILTKQLDISKLNEGQLDAVSQAITNLRATYGDLFDEIGRGADLEKTSLAVTERKLALEKERADSITNAAAAANREVEAEADAYTKLIDELQKIRDLSATRRGEQENYEVEQSTADYIAKQRAKLDAEWTAFTNMELEDIKAREDRAAELRDLTSGILNKALQEAEETETDAAAYRSKVMANIQAAWDEYAAVEIQENKAREDLAKSIRATEESIATKSTQENEEAEAASIDYKKQSLEEIARSWDAYRDMEIEENAAKSKKSAEIREFQFNLFTKSIQENAEVEADATDYKKEKLEEISRAWDEYAEIEIEEIRVKEELAAAIRAAEEKLLANLLAKAGQENLEAEQAALDYKAQKLSEINASWNAYADMEIEENAAKEAKAKAVRETEINLMSKSALENLEAEQSANDAKEQKRQEVQTSWESYADMELEDIAARESHALKMRVLEANLLLKAMQENAEVEDNALQHAKDIAAKLQAAWDEYADMELEDIKARERRAAEIRAAEASLASKASQENKEVEDAARDHAEQKRLESERVWNDFDAMEKQEIYYKEQAAKRSREAEERIAELAKQRAEIAQVAAGDFDMFMGSLQGIFDRALSGGYGSGNQASGDILASFKEFSKSYWSGVWNIMDVEGTSFEQARQAMDAALGDNIQKSGDKLVAVLNSIGSNLQNLDSSVMQNLGEGLTKAGSGLGDFIDKLIPNLGTLSAVITIFTMIYQVFYTIADGLNRLFRWGPYDPKLSEAEKERYRRMGYDVDGTDSKRAAFQISEISGPMRDSIVTALDPLKVMYSYPTYKDEIVAAILSVRDAITGTAQLGAAAALGGLQQTFNIQTINITAANGETFKSIMADLETQARLAAVGTGG